MHTHKTNLWPDNVLVVLELIVKCVMAIWRGLAPPFELVARVIWQSFWVRTGFNFQDKQQAHMNKITSHQRRGEVISMMRKKTTKKKTQQ